MAKTNAVIIKRIKKGGHAHHGGAWKVAYADFVTAMMAFFLLLWLLNATTDAQKRGIADYFAPTMATKSTTSGSGGILGGRTMTSEGAQISSFSPPSIDADPAHPPTDDDEGDPDTQRQAHKDPNDQSDDSGGQNDQTQGPKPGAWKKAGDAVAAADAKEAAKLAKNGQVDGDADKDPGPTAAAAHMNERDFQIAKGKHEEQQFKQAQSQLQQAIQDMPDLKPLAKNLVVDRTNEGLRIQLVDQDKTAMFPSGSTTLSGQAEKLMSLVTTAVGKLPNRISITGHTDSVQFAGGGNYSNWELSTDRANAARRALIQAGMPADRIASVEGRADTDNLIKEDAADPRNRRISIVVLRDAPLPRKISTAAAAIPAHS